MKLNSQFHGPNAAYVLELYDRYRKDPQSVDEETRAFFDNWKPEEDSSDQGIKTTEIAKIVGVANLAQAIRERGHLQAQLDPLGTPPPGDPSLELSTHGLTEDDLRGLPASLIGGPLAEGAANALEAIESLRKVYSSRTGYDYDQSRNPEERKWLRNAAESGSLLWTTDTDLTCLVIERLTEVEAFERFLHRIFPGKTRFSLEGLDMMVPILDEVVASAAESASSKF